MDILLTEIRPGGAESAKVELPAPEPGAAFAALLKDLPGDGSGETRANGLAAVDSPRVFDEKSMQINALDDLQELVRGMAQAPDAIIEGVSRPAMTSSTIPPPILPEQISAAVREAATSVTEIPIEANAPLTPNPVSAGRVLPRGGSGLPLAAEAAPLAPTAVAARVPPPPAQPVADQPGKVELSTRISPAPASLPATMVTDPVRDPGATLANNVDANESTAPLPRSGSVPAAATPVPATGATGTGPQAQLVPADSRAGERAAQDVARFDAQSLPGLNATAAARPPSADSGPAAAAATGTDRIAPPASNGIEIRPRNGDRIAPPSAVGVGEAAAPQAAEPAPAGSTTAVPAREAWLRAGFDVNPSPRPDARPADSGLAPVDSAGDTPLALRESLLQRPLDALQANPVQVNATPLAASGTTATPLATGAPLQPGLPPQLDTLALARDAAPADWGEGIGERVSWLINHKQNSASIRLDPPALGRLDVQIRIADDATTITIQAQQGQTRDLIDAATPRLREFLQDAGFQNVNVDVSQRQEQQLARGQNSAGEAPLDADENAADDDAELGSGEFSPAYRGDGLVDTFA